MNVSELDAAKRALRADMTARRRGYAGNRHGAALAARDRLAAAIQLPSGVVVSGYWPLDDEFDPRPILELLHGRGCAVGLPVVMGRGRPLLFRRWLPGTTLVPGSFKVMTPPPDSPEIVPEVVLAPMLAFDSLGFRLGYGGGFYDRTLAALRDRGRAIAIGVAFALQEVSAVPHDATDQPLDWIVTEQAARRFAVGRRDKSG